MTDSASDVPARFDCIIGGFGYVFWRELLQSLPFRNQRAAYSFSPLFVERTNVGQGYGDDQQDFWLTLSQNDWSGGEGQRFIHEQNLSTLSSYWAGTLLDATIPGQVTMSKGTLSSSAHTYVGIAAGDTTSSGRAGSIYATDTTNAYAISPTNGNVISLGAHSVSGPFAIASDGSDIYVGGTSVRKYNGSWSAFSASGVDGLTFVNNTLFGMRQGSNCDIVQFNTSGVLSSIYQWKGADGTIGGKRPIQVLPFGGSLLVLVSFPAPELWIYDGTNTSQIAGFPLSTTVGQGSIAVFQGIVAVGVSETIAANQGSFYTPGQHGTPTASSSRAAVYVYVNGSMTKVWHSPVNSSGTPCVTPYLDGVAVYDPGTAAILYLNLLTGSASTMSAGALTTSNGAGAATCTSGFGFLINNVIYVGPSASYAALSSTLQTSLFDADTSVPKNWKSVKIIADIPANTSIDVAYQIDGTLTGSYTTAQTGVTSGTEYPIEVTGQSISIQATLNYVSGGISPTLRRIFVRGAPLQPTFRRCQYVLDLTGTNDRDINMPVRLQDGTDSVLTGAQMAANLAASIQSTTPITVTDRFGTYNGVFEQGEGITEIDEVRPGEFVAQVTIREV